MQAAHPCRPALNTRLPGRAPARRAAPCCRRRQAGPVPQRLEQAWCGAAMCASACQCLRAGRRQQPRCCAIERQPASCPPCRVHAPGGSHGCSLRVGRQRLRGRGSREELDRRRRQRAGGVKQHRPAAAAPRALRQAGVGRCGQAWVPAGRAAKCGAWASAGLGPATAQPFPPRTHLQPRIQPVAAAAGAAQPRPTRLLLLRAPMLRHLEVGSQAAKACAAGRGPGGGGAAVGARLAKTAEPSGAAGAGRPTRQQGPQASGARAGKQAAAGHCLGSSRANAGARAPPGRLHAPPMKLPKERRLLLDSVCSRRLRSRYLRRVWLNSSVRCSEWGGRAGGKERGQAGFRGRGPGAGDGRTVRCGVRSSCAAPAPPTPSQPTQHPSRHPSRQKSAPHPPGWRSRGAPPPARCARAGRWRSWGSPAGGGDGCRERGSERQRRGQGWVHQRPLVSRAQASKHAARHALHMHAQLCLNLC